MNICGNRYVCILSTYILWRENMSISTVSVVAGRTPDMITTHQKFLRASKLLLNLNLCREDNSFLLIWIVLCPTWLSWDF